MLSKVLPAAALLLISLVAHADTTLAYQGQNFTFATNPYTTSEAVSGTLTVAGALAPNMDGLTRITPESYSFSAGPTVFASGNSLEIGGIYLYTDSGGNLVDFYLSLILLVPAPHQTSSLTSYFEDSLSVMYGPTLPSVLGDGVSYGEQGIQNTGGAYSPVQGALTVTNTNAVAPEPSSVALLGTGMMGIAGVVRRRICQP